MESQEYSEYKDRIYNYILNLILTKQIKCGEKIPELKIAEQLNVSRTPIRESIRQLANDGIINIPPKRSAEVIKLDTAFINDLAQVRWQLDTLAVKLAIFNGSNKDFSELRTLAEQCLSENEKGNLLGRIQFDAQFHLKLVEIGRNAILYDMQRRLHLTTQLWQANRLTSTDMYVEGIREHLAIVDAFEKRDEELALKLIHKHLLDSYGTAFNVMN